MTSNPLPHAVPSGVDESTLPIEPVVAHSTLIPLKSRRCLKCETVFPSEWAGERVCRRCKGSKAWRAGVTYRPGRVG
jgi:hypothetical protein